MVEVSFCEEEIEKDQKNVDNYNRNMELNLYVQEIQKKLLIVLV